MTGQPRRGGFEGSDDVSQRSMTGRVVVMSTQYLQDRVADCHANGGGRSLGRFLFATRLTNGRSVSAGC